MAEKKGHLRAVQIQSMRTSSVSCMAILLVVWLASVCAAQEQPQPSPLRVLYNFLINESQPSNPGLFKARDGRLYGTWFQEETAFDFGGVFRIEADGTFTVLHVFPSSSNGVEGNGPWGALAEGRDGNFYGTTVSGGTTASGGTQGAGTIYRVTPEGAFTLMHSFGSTAVDGASPRGGLISASDGNFYGTTPAGGRDNVGTIFRMTLTGKVTILHSFGLNQLPTGGARPVAKLVEARDGLLYGVTGFNVDSIDDYGTVFRISKKGSFEVVHRFYAPGGFAPVGPLIQACDGSFYGTTYYGGSGANAAGTVFRMTAKGKVTFLHTFHWAAAGGTSWGVSPFNALLEGKDGFFYSTIMQCGANGYDCAYRINSSGKFEVLHMFTPQEGMSTNGLIQGDDGLFYGDAQGGGVDNGIRAYGTAFSLELNSPD